jgi:hypothetical protein
MPDISMCANSAECPMRKNCYRAEESGTKPSEFRQSWMQFQWFTDVNGFPDCDNFIRSRNASATMAQLFGPKWERPVR